MECHDLKFNIRWYDLKSDLGWDCLGFNSRCGDRKSSLGRDDRVYKFGWDESHTFSDVIWCNATEIYSIQLHDSFVMVPIDGISLHYIT